MANAKSKIVLADKRFADIPVILISPQNEISDALEGYTLGSAECKPEPYSGPLLLKSIVRQLLIVQKNKVTAVCGRAGMNITEKANSQINKHEQGEIDV